MKSVTHIVASAGASFYIARHAGFSLLFSFLVALWLSFAINWVIDALGHETKHGRPVRTTLTHSVFLAPVWGGLVGCVSFVLANEVIQSQSSLLLAIFSTLLGGLIALLHLLLDAMTEKGVFWRGRRVALMHARYDDSLLNGAFILLGLLLLIAPFLGD